MWSALRSCLSEYLDLSPLGMISSFAFWRRKRRAETRGSPRNLSGGLEVGLLEPKLRRLLKQVIESLFCCHLKLLGDSRQFPPPTRFFRESSWPAAGREKVGWRPSSAD